MAAKNNFWQPFVVPYRLRYATPIDQLFPYIDAKSCLTYVRQLFLHKHLSYLTINLDWNTCPLDVTVTK